MDYLMGVDLGKRQDFSAAITIERRLKEQDRPGLPESWAHQHEPIVAAALYHIVDVKRWDIGTDYLDVIDDVRSALHKPKLLHRTNLIVDATSIGIPVIEIMTRYRMRPWGVWITGGMSSTLGDDGIYRVSKHSLVTTLQLVFQAGRIKINPGLKLAVQMKDELQKFTTKITQAGNDTYEAFAERDHDDMVMALAVAIWFSENEYGPEVVVRPVKPQEEFDPLRKN